MLDRFQIKKKKEKKSIQCFGYLLKAVVSGSIRLILLLKI